MAFVQVRPSPWRQAVDLGNMMLVLAVRNDPQRVYRQALTYFTADELAEAFAATRGVASPTKLRAFMKRDPRDLLGEFRALTPPRPPIVLQRWSIRRVSLATGKLLVISAATFAGMHASSQPVSRRLRPQLRHRPLDDPHRSCRPVSGHAALPRRTPHRLECWRRGQFQREGQPAAGLRPRGTSSYHRHPDSHLRHLGRPADPLQPARHAPVRASAEPGAEVHRPALLHLPRRLHHLPVQLRPRRIPGIPRALPCAGEGPHAQDEPAWSTRTGKPALVVAPGRGCHGRMSTGHKTAWQAARANGRDAQNWKICRKAHGVTAGLDSRKYSALYVRSVRL